MKIDPDIYPKRLPEGVRRILANNLATCSGEVIAMRDSQGIVMGLVQGAALHLEDRRFTPARHLKISKVSQFQEALNEAPQAVSDVGMVLTRLGLLSYKFGHDESISLSTLPGVIYYLHTVAYTHLGVTATFNPPGSLHPIRTGTACTTQNRYVTARAGAERFIAQLGRDMAPHLNSPHALALAKLRRSSEDLGRAQRAVREAEEQLREVQEVQRQCEEARDHCLSALPLMPAQAAPRPLDFHLHSDGLDQWVSAHDPETGEEQPFIPALLYIGHVLGYGGKGFSEDLAATILSTHFPEPERGTPLPLVQGVRLHPEVERLMKPFAQQLLRPLDPAANHRITVQDVRAWLTAQAVAA